MTVLIRFIDFVNVNGRFYGQNVGFLAKTDNLSAANRCNQRFVPEFFPGVDIGKMDFNCRHAHRRDGVP